MRKAGLGLVCVSLLFAVLGCRPTRPQGTPTPRPPWEVMTPVYAVQTTTPDASTPAQPTAAGTPQPAEASTPLPTAIPGQAPLIAIDPGHGGEDLGARHFNLQEEMDLHESTVTLDLSLRIGNKLKALGYRVFYTRDSDRYPSEGHAQADSNGVIDALEDLLWRNHIINASGADLLLSLHLNAWETDDEALWRATGGTETYYCADRPFGEQNLRFATLVHQNVLDALGRLGDEVSDRGVMKDNLPPDPRHMIILGPVGDNIEEATQMPGVLSEPVFITCDREAALLQKPEALDALADAYVQAIVEYFKEFPPQ